VPALASVPARNASPPELNDSSAYKRFQGDPDTDGFDDEEEEEEEVFVVVVVVVADMDVLTLMNVTLKLYGPVVPKSHLSE
jgi:hypothetical protein